MTDPTLYRITTYAAADAVPDKSIIGSTRSTKGFILSGDPDFVPTPGETLDRVSVPANAARQIGALLRSLNGEDGPTAAALAEYVWPIALDEEIPVFEPGDLVRIMPRNGNGKLSMVGVGRVLAPLRTDNGLAYSVGVYAQSGQDVSDIGADQFAAEVEEHVRSNDAGAVPFITATQRAPFELVASPVADAVD